jgi:integrase
MARKAGQIIARGQSTWLVRVYLGRDPQTGTRKYRNQTLHGSFREAQRFLNLKVQLRDNGRVSRAAVLSLNQLLDQWLTTVVKARVRTRTFKDYETLLKLYIRPALGGRLIGTLSQIDIQSLYAQMFEPDSRHVQSSTPTRSSDRRFARQSGGRCSPRILALASISRG